VTQFPDSVRLKGSLAPTPTPSSHSSVQESPTSCSIPPVQESLTSCSISPVQESLTSCSIPPVQESLPSNVDDINPATGRRWKRLKDFLPNHDSASTVFSSPVSPVRESSSPIPPVSRISPVSSVSTPSPILPVQESTSPTSPASPICPVPEPSPSPSSIQDEEAMVSSISRSIPSAAKKKSRYQELADNPYSIPDPYGDKIRAEIRKRLEKRSVASPDQGELSSRWHMPPPPREYPATSPPLHDHSDISEVSSSRRSPVSESPVSDDLPDFEDHPNPFWLEELEERLRDNFEDCKGFGHKDGPAPYRSPESPVTFRRGLKDEDSGYVPHRALPADPFKDPFEVLKSRG
jgi:hypothetical protein